MYMDFEKMVLGTLANDAFVMVNKQIARKVGFVEAGMLGELIFTFKTVEEQKKFFQCDDNKKWFYLTQQAVEEKLGIKRREHENAIKKLVSFGIIEKTRMGLPAKTYYAIDFQKIGEIFYEKEPEPAPLTDWTKRTNKGGRNVQTGLDERSIHTIYKKDQEKETYKKDYKKDLNLNQEREETEIRSLDQEEPNTPKKDVHDLVLPEKVKTLIFDYDLHGYGHGQGLYNSLDPLEIERFYNTSPYIQPSASKDDANYINNYDFFNIVKSIIERGPRPVKNSIGILRKYALNKLSFKTDNEDYQRDVEGFSNNPSEY